MTFAVMTWTAVCAIFAVMAWRWRRAVVRARRCEDRYRDILWEYRRLADLVPVHWFGVDPATGAFKFGNRSFRENWAMPGTGEIGKTDSTLPPSPDSRLFSDFVLSGGSAPNGLERPVEFQDANGAKHFGILYQRMFERLDGSKILLCSVVDHTKMRQLENELNDLRNLMRFLTEHMPCHFFVRARDAGNQYRWVSRRLLTDMGFPADYWIGKTPDEVLPSELAAQVASGETALPEDGTAVELVYPREFADGAVHRLHTTECLMDSIDGKMVVGIEIDQTEREESLIELRKNLNRNRILNACLVSALLTHDEESAQESLLRAVGEMLNAESCYLIDYDWASSRAKLRSEYHRPETPPLAPHFPTQPFPPDEEWVRRFRTRQGLIFPDLLQLEAQDALRYWLPLARACDIRSLYSFGIFQDGNSPDGSLGVAFRGRTRPFSASEREFLVAAARIVELMRRFGREHRKGAHEEAVRQAVFNAIAVPAALFDRNGKPIRINTAARARFGDFSNFPAPGPDSPEALAAADGGVHSGIIRYGLQRYRLTVAPLSGSEPCLVKTYLEISSTPASDAPPKPVPNGGRRVLLVDDVPMNLKVLGAMCARLGVETVSALSGSEAIEILRRGGISMVFTDLWMPGMNGRELAAFVREDSSCRAVPVIAVTADTETTPEDGFDGVLLKPVTLDKLRSFLSSAVK